MLNLNLCIFSDLGLNDRLVNDGVKDMLQSKNSCLIWKAKYSKKLLFILENQTIMSMSQQQM